MNKEWLAEHVAMARRREIAEYHYQTLWGVCTVCGVSQFADGLDEQSHCRDRKLCERWGNERVR